MWIVYNREKNSTIIDKNNCTTTVESWKDEKIRRGKKIY